jgi:nucleotide-binding universal stress UspA family protein
LARDFCGATPPAGKGCAGAIHQVPPPGRYAAGTRRARAEGMDNPRRILCPTDFSDGAAAATEQALALAHAFGGTVTLLHVYSVPAYMFPDGSAFVAGPEVTARIEHEVSNALAAAARSAERRSGVPVLTRSAIGAPYEEILRLSKEFDLIVMGTHGRTGLRHLVLGSVAEKVVRHANCPVLTVRVAEGAHARHPPVL